MVSVLPRNRTTPFRDEKDLSQHRASRQRDDGSLLPRTQTTPSRNTSLQTTLQKSDRRRLTPTTHNALAETAVYWRSAQQNEVLDKLPAKAKTHEELEEMDDYWIAPAAIRAQETRRYCAPQQATTHADSTRRRRAQVHGPRPGRRAPSQGLERLRGSGQEGRGLLVLSMSTTSKSGRQSTRKSLAKRPSPAVPGSNTRVWTMARDGKDPESDSFNRKSARFSMVQRDELKITLPD
ncbi:uncharacterized protein PG998_002908 [Apiospora kogelbergensis]|uniref:uncharacterized protein n=1 Tax=Apiospora kogelbergensis TaxID=1337665 RepID=UPI00312EDFC4